MSDTAARHIAFNRWKQQKPHVTVPFEAFNAGWDAALASQQSSQQQPVSTVIAYDPDEESHEDPES